MLSDKSLSSKAEIKGKLKALLSAIKNDDFYGDKGVLATALKEVRNLNKGYNLVKSENTVLTRLEKKFSLTRVQALAYVVKPTGMTEEEASRLFTKDTSPANYSLVKDILTKFRVALILNLGLASKSLKISMVQALPTMDHLSSAQALYTDIYDTCKALDVPLEFLAGGKLNERVELAIANHKDEGRDSTISRFIHRSSANEPSSYNAYDLSRDASSNGLVGEASSLRDALVAMSGSEDSEEEMDLYVKGLRSYLELSKDLLKIIKWSSKAILEDVLPVK